jgi:hypothetical protein
MKQPLLYFLIHLFSIVPALSQELPYPDYRSKRESFSKVADKTLRADIATFAIGGLDESMGKLPLRKTIPTSYDRKSITFKDDRTEIKVTTGPFDSKGKKLMLTEEHLVKINGKPFYGCYGQMPKTEIKELIVVNGKDTVSIPPIAYSDLFDLNFTYRDKNGVERTGCGLFYSSDGKRKYIYLLSRDDLGSYEVTWVIENGLFLRRVLDYGFTK